jgi:hypothetical protein
MQEAPAQQPKPNCGSVFLRFRPERSVQPLEQHAVFQIGFPATEAEVRAVFAAPTDPAHPIRHLIAAEQSRKSKYC